LEIEASWRRPQLSSITIHLLRKGERSRAGRESALGTRERGVREKHVTERAGRGIKGSSLNGEVF